MRRIIVGAMVSLDGVMQAPGGPTEDPTNGFALGGWVAPYFDEAFGEEVDRMLTPERDLLLGRKTYEIFAAYWPHYDQGGEDQRISTLFNKITKYVVSRSGEVDTSWQRSVLLRDIAEVKRLREQGDRDLVTQGSTELIHALLADDLVDAMSLFVVPVILGGGKKLFADGSVPHSYRLTGSRVSKSGIVIAHYERAGAVRIANAAVGTPSDAERKRQARMKREGWM